MIKAFQKTIKKIIRYFQEIIEQEIESMDRFYGQYA